MSLFWVSGMQLSLLRLYWRHTQEQLGSYRTHRELWLPAASASSLPHGNLQDTSSSSKALSKWATPNLTFIIVLSTVRHTWKHGLTWTPSPWWVLGSRDEPPLPDNWELDLTLTPLCFSLENRMNKGMFSWCWPPGQLSLILALYLSCFSWT